MFGVNFDFQGSKVNTKAHSSIRLLCCRDLQSCSCCRKLNCGKQGFIRDEEKYSIKDNLLKGPGRNLARVSLVQTGIWELDATQPECGSRTCMVHDIVFGCLVLGVFCSPLLHQESLLECR